MVSTYLSQQQPGELGAVLAPPRWPSSNVVNRSIAPIGRTMLVRIYRFKLDCLGAYEGAHEDPEHRAVQRPLVLDIARRPREGEEQSSSRGAQLSAPKAPQ